jgi:alkylhydroperoxidase/carboxymuconolactone decarboxylase family protein YurZ
MGLMMKTDEIAGYFRSHDWGKKNRRLRMLSFLSASIAIGNNDQTTAILRCLKTNRVARVAIYETILQSYLFLGFPKMIEAAICFGEVFGQYKIARPVRAYTSKEMEKWFRMGYALCRRVYGRNFRLLEKRFSRLSPELFRWMVIEGYGKVLSRPGLSQKERELAEVAALIAERRERQLISHLLGSLNVGADIRLLKEVAEDIAPLVGIKASRLADKTIDMVERKYAAEK